MSEASSESQDPTEEPTQYAPEEDQDALQEDFDDSDAADWDEESD